MDAESVHSHCMFLLHEHKEPRFGRLQLFLCLFRKYEKFKCVFFLKNHLEFLCFYCHCSEQMSVRRRWRLQTVACPRTPPPLHLVAKLICNILCKKIRNRRKTLYTNKCRTPPRIAMSYDLYECMPDLARVVVNLWLTTIIHTHILTFLHMQAHTYIHTPMIQQHQIHIAIKR